MEQVVYERPREKTMRYGASTLSMVELLQLIIGSGSQKVSGAELARGVAELISENRVTYQSLMELKGMGEAKTCQILSVYELANRFSVGK